MYSPKRAKQIKANPATRLLFSSEQITSEVKTRALAEKDEAIRLIDRMIEIWESLRGKIEPGVHGPCCMDHPEGCLIMVFFDTGDNLDAT